MDLAGQIVLATRGSKGIEELYFTLAVEGEALSSQQGKSEIEKTMDKLKKKILRSSLSRRTCVMKRM
ncbi:hypothetical protein [Methanosarcina mazei]|uniref:hypothetical protein n=1 Tax=Methanosarcina mazei TaxID=2209 RepID=UPI0006D3FD4C|nr:hypothetical protein [Methanosarcina mazei]